MSKCKCKDFKVRIDQLTRYYTMTEDEDGIRWGMDAICYGVKPLYLGFFKMRGNIVERMGVELFWTAVKWEPELAELIIDFLGMVTAWKWVDEKGLEGDEVKREAKRLLKEIVSRYFELEEKVQQEVKTSEVSGDTEGEGMVEERTGEA